LVIAKPDRLSQARLRGDPHGVRRGVRGDRHAIRQQLSIHILAASRQGARDAVRQGPIPPVLYGACAGLRRPRRVNSRRMSHLSSAILPRRQIIKKFGRGFDACHQQMVPRTRAGNIEKMSLGIVDILQIGVVTDGFDALLQRRSRIGTGRWEPRSGGRKHPRREHSRARSPGTIQALADKGWTKTSGGCEFVSA
jgi:hypothetical protein